MGAENVPDLRRQRSKAMNRRCVCVEIRFWTIEPDGAWVVGITGEKQSVGFIEEADSVRCVAGSRDHLQGSASQVELLAIMDRFLIGTPKPPISVPKRNYLPTIIRLLQ